jgi:hypothetical protein
MLAWVDGAGDAKRGIVTLSTPIILKSSGEAHSNHPFIHGLQK